MDEIKSAEWDIEVPEFKVKGKEWLKSQVSRAFLPKYFPGYNKYLWIDADAWVNSWDAIELYFKGCENKKLSINSPLARGLIGKTKDDIVEINSPKGVKSYNVLSVKFK